MGRTIAYLTKTTSTDATQRCLASPLPFPSPPSPTSTEPRPGRQNPAGRLPPCLSHRTAQGPPFFLSRQREGNAPCPILSGLQTPGVNLRLFLITTHLGSRTDSRRFLHYETNLHCKYSELAHQQEYLGQAVKDRISLASLDPC